MSFFVSTDSVGARMKSAVALRSARRSSPVVLEQLLAVLCSCPPVSLVGLAVPVGQPKVWLSFRSSLPKERPGHFLVA